jgi:hypothetical protein
MLTLENKKLGGKTMAERQRKEALEKYYASPNTCKQCGGIIKVVEGRKIQEARKKKFCNQSCAAKYNNIKHPKRTHKNFCNDCGMKITGSHPRCANCEGKRKSSILAKKTKKEVFLSRSNWQCARNSIRRNAAYIYEKSGKSQECFVCKYTRHIEVSHRKSVADFPESATIGEINEINNLVALCPTHHWEFDNGYLKL